jgi:hypothetical protein
MESGFPLNECSTANGEGCQESQFLWGSDQRTPGDDAGALRSVISTAFSNILAAERPGSSPIWKSAELSRFPVWSLMAFG